MYIPVYTPVDLALELQLCSVPQSFIHRERDARCEGDTKCAAAFMQWGSTSEQHLCAHISSAYIRQRMNAYSYTSFHGVGQAHRTELFESLDYYSYSEFSRSPVSSMVQSCNGSCLARVPALLYHTCHAWRERSERRNFIIIDFED